MSLIRLTNLLNEKHINFVTIPHALAYTAQETAASAHIPGVKFAKTVIVKVDGKLIMAVLPAQFKIQLGLLKNVTGARHIELASEEDFKEIFPGCDTGAMPPFGNLYGMEVFVEDSLLDDEEIVFNAGSHTELIKIPYHDFMRIVEPKIARFSTLH